MTDIISVGTLIMRSFALNVNDNTTIFSKYVVYMLYICCIYVLTYLLYRERDQILEF